MVILISKWGDIMNIKDKYNFLLYGDSISKGVTYDEEKGRYITIKDSYAALLQDKLKGMIFNAGRFGNTIIRGISKLSTDVLKNNPDIVVVEFGGNDCDFNWEEVANNPLGEHVPNTDFNLFQNSLKDLVSSLKGNNITPVLMTLPPIDADRYFKWISKYSDSMGSNILRFLGSVNKIYWWQERYSSAVINVAQETNTKWIDVRGAFLQTPDYRKLICKDGIHPNTEGHKIIADKIFEFVKCNYSFLLKDETLSTL